MTGSFIVWRTVTGDFTIGDLASAQDHAHWIVDLQNTLGITREQTVVFGDFLNGLEMLDEAELSFAMANAHPKVIERARYLAPSNADDGVVAVMEHLLG